MSRQRQRDRIEHALESLPWPFDSRADRRTLAGLIRQAFAPELARGADAEDTVARVRAAVRGLPTDGTVPVRRVLDALYGEEARR